MLPVPQKRLRKAQQGGWRRSCSSRKPLLESEGSEARRCEMTCDLNATDMHRLHENLPAT